MQITYNSLELTESLNKIFKERYDLDSLEGLIRNAIYKYSINSKKASPDKIFIGIIFPLPVNNADKYTFQLVAYQGVTIQYHDTFNICTHNKSFRVKQSYTRLDE